jgi:hypothetical protein
MSQLHLNLDRKSKAKRPELVRHQDQLPTTRYREREKYVIAANTKLVARAEIEKTALDAVLKRWRAEISRADMKKNHPKLF